MAELTTMGARTVDPARARAQFQANIPGNLEAVHQPLYHYQAYAAAGQNTLTFFQTPYGQLANGILDTNMTQPGQLPAPQQFLLTGISVVFFPGVSPGAATGASPSEFINDVWAVGKGGILTLNVLSKQYCQMAPLGEFSPDFRMDVSAALSDTTTAAASRLTEVSYASWVGPKFKVAPIMLLPSQNFSVTLTWPTVVALPSTVAGRIGVRLEGTLYRAVG